MQRQQYRETTKNAVAFVGKLQHDAVCDGIANASRDFRFATSVSWFGTLLRHPERARQLPYRKLIAMTEAAQGTDRHGYRAELLRMMTAARRLSNQR